jgi:diaminopimelate decarboxylase
MPKFISDDSIARTVQRLLEANAISRDADTSVLLYDLSFLEQVLSELKMAFPKNAVHSIAVKANPLVEVLEFLKKEGCGLEVASGGELMLARAINVGPKNVVFDSPAKTIEELSIAIDYGCHINVDSFQELDRIDSLLAKMKGQPKATFGVRINPQIGTGSIETTSVAGEYSKFGIPLREFRGEILQAYWERPWLTGIHLHVGSQGCSMKMLSDGCAAVFELAEACNHRRTQNGFPRQINIFDLGGGLPVSYRQDERTETLTSYADCLSARFPSLFSTAYKLVTEFGRHVHANAGWVLTRVEYVKPSAKVQTAILHVGADMFLRECYQPGDWHHDVIVLDKRGELKTGELVNYNLAGPLCFSGDFLGKNMLLPPIDPGDYLVIRDAGAYTLSMWSRYNSRQIPLVLGYRDEGMNVAVLRERESLDEILAFWKSARD